MVAADALDAKSAETGAESTETRTSSEILLRLRIFISSCSRASILTHPGAQPGSSYCPVYGRVSAGGVCPSTKAGLPCDVMVTVADVRPGELAVITLVPE